MPKLKLIAGVLAATVLSFVLPLVLIGGCDILVRGQDPTKVVNTAWGVLKVFAFMAVGVAMLAVVIGIWRGAWKLAERPNAFWKQLIIAAVCLAPIALILKDYEIDMDTFVSKFQSWPRYFFAALIILIAYRVSRTSNAPALRKYLAAYTTIVVLMWMAAAGVFHSDEPGDYIERYTAPHGPLHIESAERLLCNIVVYCAGAFLGITAAHRIQGRHRPTGL